MRIPADGKSESYRPLNACVVRAANGTGISQQTAALVMSYFFEEMVEQMTKGRIVRIPGFGAFGPKIDASRRAKRANGRPVPRPSWSPSYGVYTQILHCCPTDTISSGQMRKHQQNHGPGGTLTKRGQPSPPWEAQERFRARVREQIIGD